MQILIKISDEDYIKISNSNPSYADDFNLYYAVKNGTILPKGHGKIVDANRVLENGDNWEVETALMQTEAIIEADKESEEL